MRPIKKMPTHMLSSTAARAQTSSTLLRSMSMSQRLSAINLLPICAMVATLCLTCIYFIAIRRHNVELSFKQLSTFQRQVRTLGNWSLYYVPLPQRQDDEDFLSTFSSDDWSKLSLRIDFVVFLYDDINSFAPSFSWISSVASAFDRLRPVGYGIVLFSCGCVVPNLVFRRTQTRFQAFECFMLPGFVMPSSSVAWVNTSDTLHPCHHRQAASSTHWYQTNAWKLEKARHEHSFLRNSLTDATTTTTTTKQTNP